MRMCNRSCTPSQTDCFAARERKRCDRGNGSLRANRSRVKTSQGNFGESAAVLPAQQSVGYAATAALSARVAFCPFGHRAALRSTLHASTSYPSTAKRRQSCRMSCAQQEANPDPDFWSMQDRDYPEGVVVLGIEIRSHSVKGAPVDTGNGEFLRAGTHVAIHDDRSPDSIVAAVKKLVANYRWTGPIGCSITRAVWRTLGRNNASEVLRRALPDSKGEVAVMIHTEAAAQAAVGFGEARNQSGRVLVCTLGKGFGVQLYENGESMRKDFTHMTWQWASKLSSLQRVDGWEGLCPSPHPTDVQPAASTSLQESPHASPHTPSTHSNGAESSSSTAPASTSDSDNRSQQPHLASLDEEKMEAEMAERAQEQWRHWVELVDELLARVTSHVRPLPSMVLAVPTGDLTKAVSKATFPLHDLHQLRGTGVEFVVAERPVGMIVKGAARWAIKEQVLGMRAERKVGAAIGKKYGGSQFLQCQLSEAELQEVLTMWDGESKDGVVSLKDMRSAWEACLAEGAGLLHGLTENELNSLFRRIDAHFEGHFDLPRLGSWYNETIVKSAKVRLVLTAGEFDDLLAEGAFAMTVVKVTAEGCRACFRFERSFEKFAEQYPHVQFVTLRMDHNRSLAHLCSRFDVEGTPTFLFFDRSQKCIERVVGSNTIKFEKKLKEVEAKLVRDPAADAAPAASSIPDVPQEHATSAPEVLQVPEAPDSAGTRGTGGARVLQVPEVPESGP